MRLTRLYFLLILFVNHSFSQQNGQEVFKHIFAEELGVLYISNQHFDSKGNLWAVTEKGLMKYNGYSTKFYIGTPEYDSLFTLDNIFYVIETGSNEVWLSYAEGPTLTKFNINTEEYVHYKYDPISESESSNLLITHVQRDSKDRVWFSTWGAGFYQLDENTLEFRKIQLPNEQEDENYPSYIKGFTELKDGRFLITFFNEQAEDESWPIYYNPEKNSFERINVDELLSHITRKHQPLILETACRIVNFVYEDVNSNIWFGTYSGLLFYDVQAERIDRISPSDFSSNRNVINALSYVINDDELWVCTPNYGIMVVNINTKDIHFIQKDSDIDGSLDDNRVFSASKDNRGNIWVSTRSWGFNIYLNELQQFNLLDWEYLGLEYRDRSRQRIPLSHFIVEDSLIYISHVKGIDVYNIHTKKISDFAWPNQKKVGEWDENSIADFRILDETIPATTKGNGYASIYYRKDRKVKVFDGEKVNSSLLFKNGVNDEPIAFFESREDFYTILRYQKGEINTREYFITSAEGFGLSEDFSFVLSSGEWLISASGGRFVIIDPEEKKHRLFSPSSKENYFPDSTIRCAYYDGDNVWFGTSNGLYQFDEKSGESKQMNEEIGLNNNVQINAIYIDEFGNYWLALRYDIYCWQTENDKGLYFGKNYGLTTGEFIPSKVWKDEKGDLYFNSINGLLTFNPNKIIRPGVSFDISISQLWINDSILGSSEMNDVLAGGHVFEWKENFLTFDFQSNQIISVHPHEFEYRVIGQNESWVSNGTSNRVRLADIQYGEYDLQVKAINSHNIESNIISIPFTIKRPFWLATWFYIVLIIGSIFGVVYYMKRRERILKRRSLVLEEIVTKRTAEVETQRNEANIQREIVEEKQKEITDSIEYAKRIQEAILPNDDFFKSQLSNSFILYLPKDIVAGDFYWMHELKDQILFAAADCTGHGVPGAMVSVVCNNALNRSVREFEIDDPGKLLDQTREIVIEQFEKSTTDNRVNESVSEIKDGMDISVCLLNKKKSILKWAGANNPLWIVRGKKLILFNGDKQPIGKYDPAVPFKTHTVELQKNDMIYVFTDGYADQFGGDKGKKFKTKSFKKLLVSISDSPIHEQKVKLKEAFDNWKGNLEQVDDVCVIGVRM